MSLVRLTYPELYLTPDGTARGGQVTSIKAAQPILRSAQIRAIGDPIRAVLRLRASAHFCPDRGAKLSRSRRVRADSNCASGVTLGWAA